ncbi:MAG: M20 family metallopeptidase [Candidatus Levyibacteriota bacterium]
MKLLQELLQISSYSGHEEKIAKYIFSYCKKNGIDVFMQEKNVIAFIAGKNKNTAFIFNAHMDTVSYGDKNLWTYPPISNNAGVITNGKIYGLGASDVKGSIAVLLQLLKELKQTQPATDIFFAFTTQEEIDGKGTKEFLAYFQKEHAKQYKKISAIVSEATNASTLELGHRGDIKIKITVQGQTGHASRPKEVKNHAIFQMIEIIEEMKIFADFIEKYFSDDVLGIPTCALTGITSNENSVNKIPSTCTTTWDIRTTPKLHTKLIPLLKKKLKNQMVIEEISSGPPAIVKKDEAIVKLFQKIKPDIKLTISPGSNDMTFFIAAGIPAVTFGPGTKKVIHKENEYIEIKKMDDSFRILKKLIIN